MGKVTGYRALRAEPKPDVQIWNPNEKWGHFPTPYAALKAIKKSWKENPPEGLWQVTFTILEIENYTEFGEIYAIVDICKSRDGKTYVCDRTNPFYCTNHKFGRKILHTLQVKMR